MPTAPARRRNGCRVTRVGGTPRGRSGRELTGSALNMQVDHGFRSAHVHAAAAEDRSNAGRAHDRGWPVGRACPQPSDLVVQFRKDCVAKLREWAVATKSSPASSSRDCVGEEPALQCVEAG
jgi:hypothetical protein